MFTVAIIGPDGAGKTSVARQVAASLPFPARYLYMGENPDASNETSPLARFVWGRRRKRGRLPDAGGPPPLGGAAGRRGALRSIVHLVVLLSEEWYRHRWARRQVKRGTVVLFDRHFVADYWAHDVTGSGRSPSSRLHGAVLRRYPRPALTVLLDAPPLVLRARKQDGTLDEITARRDEYLRFVAAEGSVRTIDASQPLDTVQRQVTDLIVDLAGDRQR